MSKPTKYIKITSPNGVVSFTAFTKDVYNRLNDQNKNRGASTKQKIEELEMTEEDLAKETGYDENAALEMNPTAQKLISDNGLQAAKIADLEAQLAAAKKAKKD